MLIFCGLVQYFSLKNPFIISALSIFLIPIYSLEIKEAK